MKNLEKIIETVFNIKIEKSDENKDIEFKEISSWDSLSHMEFIASIEKEYNIELVPEEIISMISKSSAEKIINKKL